MSRAAPYVRSDGRAIAASDGHGGGEFMSTVYAKGERCLTCGSNCVVGEYDDSCGPFLHCEDCGNNWIYPDKDKTMTQSNPTPASAKGKMLTKEEIAEIVLTRKRHSERNARFRSWILYADPDNMGDPLKDICDPDDAAMEAMKATIESSANIDALLSHIATLEPYKRAFHNLCAIIHRDGGHRQNELGDDIQVVQEDCQKIVADSFQKIAALEEKNAEIQAELQKYKDAKVLVVYDGVIDPVIKGAGHKDLIHIKLPPIA